MHKKEKEEEMVPRHGWRREGGQSNGCKKGIKVHYIHIPILHKEGKHIIKCSNI